MKKPYSISIDEELMAKVDEIAPRNRSKFVTEAIQLALGGGVAPQRAGSPSPKAEEPTYANGGLKPKKETIDDLQAQIDALVKTPNFRTLPTSTARRLARQELERT